MSKTGLEALPKVRRSMKEVSPMEDKKIYLLAELTIPPGFLEEVKAILKEALIQTLQEPGCEALYETGRKDDPQQASVLRSLLLCGSTFGRAKAAMTGTARSSAHRAPSWPARPGRSFLPGILRAQRPECRRPRPRLRCRTLEARTIEGPSPTPPCALRARPALRR